MKLKTVLEVEVKQTHNESYQAILTSKDNSPYSGVGNTPENAVKNAMLIAAQGLNCSNWRECHDKKRF